jgi:hypothetical protein
MRWDEVGLCRWGVGDGFFVMGWEDTDAKGGAVEGDERMWPSIHRSTKFPLHVDQKGLLDRRSTSRSAMSAPAPQPPRPIKAPLPLVIGIRIEKRLAHDDNDSTASPEYITFYPPNAPQQWPRTMGDIKAKVMDSYLALGGPGTIGSTTSTTSCRKLTNLWISLR